ncbi:efflux RND transporter periplasmic adaptor subunit [Duganella sp. BJB488]|uniref:efflux RND transporter periplasmic adaptor subunit n=1 Tax=unclassified Duganella TaxID=2636909 RepID=UPI000E34510C|nr:MULTISPECIES: efflux RND transporter periplasmic adaptor subunit [unclassified Duganella]NVD73401.1 efflux RND transporter periplasmic adaptor subunit [Duganella sp. BJB1802]RFP21851.1 efflux RND transporter periplasmic adaptor subunit [Duganella sp. BJB489]RFP23645.1 efflux RND transporter periplasmic adaptor subunit [Duganella sp. BJB488]RFP38811.1 efflux RND transporter periplasmic adaptor subunit [Duganella sp. BJB480]
MTRMNLIGAALLLALAAGGAWWYSHAGGAGAAAGDEPGGGSVLVQTVKASMQPMPLTLSVFGDVAAGKVESQSLPQAGQLTRIAVVAGQAVRRGELLAVLSSDPNALVAYEQAASAMEFARRELGRQRELLALQLSTQSQVDAAAKAATDAQAMLAAQARLNGAHGSVELKAQFDGVVAAIPVVQGDRVAAGATIVQLGRTDGLKVLLAVEPARVAELKPGMKVTLAPLQEDAPAVASTLVSIQNMVDPKTQMAGAIALLPAAAQARMPVGSHLQGAIELGSRAAWSLPRQAVLVDDQGAYLFQVAQGKARRVAVRKLVEADRLVGVDGPLDAALPVVALGNYELHDGDAVRGSTP